MGTGEPEWKPLKVYKRWEQPTDEEFEHWVHPDHAVVSTDAIEALEEQRGVLRRLEGGRMIAVAATAKTGFNRPLDPLVRVPMHAWAAAGESARYHFWRHGDLIVELGGTTGYGDGRTEYYYDIKFDPESFGSSPFRTALPVDAGRGSDDEPINDKPPLSDSLLEKWATLFKDAYPQGSEGLARRSVNGMFPDKHVTRTRLRRVIPDRPEGRPKKNNSL